LHVARPAPQEAILEPQARRPHSTFLAPCSSSAPSPITMYTALRPNRCMILSKQLSFPAQSEGREGTRAGEDPGQHPASQSSMKVKMDAVPPQCTRKGGCEALGSSPSCTNPKLKLPQRAEGVAQVSQDSNARPQPPQTKPSPQTNPSPQIQPTNQAIKRMGLTRT
jgi:hypothetical protein